MQKHVQARRAGFSLLELLCALSVLAVASFGAIQLYIWGLSATKGAQQELVAARLMTNELEAWRAVAAQGLREAAAAPLRALADEAAALEALQGAVWIARATPGPAGLFEVRVRVQWHGAGGRDYTREAVTLIAAPEATP